ncbi:MAG: hypothetical protein JWO77_1289 [Ilumatobacteraceae bacterium]|nr:hypothetical protein [Ilumatobacteraceae bacterium]
MRRILAALALAACVSGCGGSGASDSSAATTGSSGQTTSSPPSTTATTVATTTTEAPAPKYRLLSEGDLRGSLVGIQDLPVGYSQDPPETDNVNKTFCDYKPPFDEKVKVRQSFTKGGGMSTEALSLGLRQYESPEQAKAGFDAMTKALETCTGETFEGSKLTYAPMSAPKIGDASIGVRMKVDDTDVLQFFVLVGPTLVNTGGGGVMDANTDEITGVLQAQVDKYRAAASD